MTSSQNAGIATDGIDFTVRLVAWILFAAMVAFLLNSYLTFWLEWPGTEALFKHFGGDERYLLSGNTLLLAWSQLLIYPLALVAVFTFVSAGPKRSLLMDSDTFASISAFIIRAAFWSVLLVGLADMVISFMRIEEMLSGWISEGLITQLGRPEYRSTHVHYPLIVTSMVIAYFTRSIGFHWLAILVVIAEFQIVIARFIFSYEQAFMGDLVRFWYAALFLFASSYTLIHEGHVRVDVVYAYFSDRSKAWANAIGSLMLGVPICWIILSRGLSSKSSIISSPLLNHEISQSGFGMYTKYLMAGFLLIYAISMMVQFISYFLRSVAVIRGAEVPQLESAPVH
ncbi:MAG: hypothetical protein DHS20C01_05850 [marine bacterium B5-7]|nr:MAG: hypothetical protein DHS20C01_05850 [marine bacterium B5-7]